MQTLRTPRGLSAPSPSGMPAVEVVDLCRRYGSFEAVRGISFTVHAGEVLALLGVNGAGKTSALEVVEGLAPAHGGRVRILGHDPLHERAAVRRCMGVVLQNAGLPADLTVRETLAMWGRTLTDPQPIDDALTQVDLVDRAAVRTGSLSGGERRRLDVALALLGRPRVVVLDEPATGLDPACSGLNPIDPSRRRWVRGRSLWCSCAGQATHGTAANRGGPTRTLCNGGKNRHVGRTVTALPRAMAVQLT